MAIIFDGRSFAAKKEEDLKKKVLDLKVRGIVPHLASILIGSDPASKLYVGLKKKAAERIGAELDIYFLPEKSKVSEVFELIKSLNRDENVNGIMIQLPLPGSLQDSKFQILDSISPEKDVDGLQADSQFLHPTSKAAIDILKEAERELKTNPKTVCVVGATGMVGAPLVKELKRLGYDLTDERETADVLISCTGKQNLIDGSMIKNGAIVIDVGSPKGDIEFESVSRKAGFITPVPGGVGPVTISSLLENLVSACYNSPSHAD